MSRESEFQARVIVMAKLHGWRVWHVPAPMRHDSRGRGWVPAQEAAGLPDLILIHDDPPRLVFMELKRKGGKLTDKQQEFLQAAKNVADAIWCDDEMFRGDVGVFACWPDDEERIEQMLRTKVVA